VTPSASNGALTVAVATRDTESAASLGAALSALGYEVAVVPARSKIAARVVEVNPHAVIIDVGDGDADRTIRALSRIADELPQCYLLALNAGGDDSIGVRAIESGADAILCVPTPVRGAAGTIAAQIAHGVRHKALVAEAAALRQEAHEAREDLRRQGVIDPATACYNDRYLDVRLQEEVTRARRYERSLALVCVDIDGFAAYAKANGDEMASFALRQLVGVLRYGLRATDAVCRREADEFAIILPETDSVSVVTVGEKMRRAASDCAFPHAECLPQGRMTVSVGCAHLRPEHKGAAELLEAATNALCDAKLRGGDTVCW